MQTTYVSSLHLSPAYNSFTFTSPRKPSTFLGAVKNDAGKEREYDHKLIDENMIVLRMRIQELRQKEQDDRGGPSSRWMEWGKQLHKNYDSDVFKAIGLLQTLLMDARPSVVLGVVALLMFSTSTSLFVVLSHLVGKVM